MGKENRVQGISGIRLLILIIFLLLFIQAHAMAGGRLKVGFSADESLETLICDEAWQYSEMGSIFWPLIYDQLWMLGPAPDYKAIPRLATHWKSKDHKTWRFFLNKQAAFHDGRPVTAEDVVFSLTHLAQSDPAWDYPDVAFESIKAIDQHTVEFTLDHVHGGKFPPAYWQPILPSHIWKPYEKDLLSFKNEHAIGSGPFKLRKFKPGEFVWLEKNSLYHGPKPKMDEVVFKSYGSNDALYLALKSGAIDMIGYSGATAVTIPGFEKTKHVKVIISPGIELVWLTFNLFNDTSLRDLNVRKAMMFAINKERLAKLVFRGQASLIDSFIYPEFKSYNHSLPRYDYNPKLSQKILDKAGYNDRDADGIRNDPKTEKNLIFSLMVPSDWAEHVKMARLIKEQMQRIGIKISLKVIDLNTYYDFLYQPKESRFDLAVNSEEPGPHSDWIWEFVRSYNNGGEGWNTAYYNNPEFDRVLDKMLAAINEPDRIQYRFKLQEIVAGDLPYALLLRPNRINPVRTDRLTNYVETMGGISTWINPWTYLKADIKQ